jgi:hypothetical protein
MRHSFNEPDLRYSGVSNPRDYLLGVTGLCEEAQERGDTLRARARTRGRPEERGVRAFHPLDRAQR